MIYLDSAAVVKLVHAEAESDALRHWLGQRTHLAWTSSVLTEIETFRVLSRHAPEVVARLPRLLDTMDLIEIEPGIRILAQTIKPATVRSLDAIHLATALSMRRRLTFFITYDKRLADAAAQAGLIVEMPA